MSLDDVDDWEYEQALDWYQTNWSMPELALRPTFDYLKPVPFDSGILGRLQAAFRVSGIREAPELHDERATIVLLACLNAVKDTVECAKEISGLDAHAFWMKHEIWIAPIDERISGATAPAALFIESKDAYGVPDEHDLQQLCAAIGLWCYGEQARLAETKDYPRAMAMLEQAALALAEADWHRGAKYQKRVSKKELAERNRAAAGKRHEVNKRNKLSGFELWQSRDWKVQADAERAIADHCHITKDVAGRWIRDFKHSGDAYLALQSKHSAANDP